MSAEASQTVGSLRERIRKYPLDSHPVEHATIQFNIGMALAEAPDGDRPENLRSAIVAYAEALRVFGETDHPLQRGRVLTGLGTAERELGLVKIARDRFSQAREVLDGLDAPAEIGAACNNLGLAETDLGRYEQAVDAFDRALEAFTTENYPRQRATALINRGIAFSKQGSQVDLESAISDYRSAASLVEPSDASYVFALAHHSLGVALLGMPGPRDQHLAEAIRSLDTSLNIFTRSAYPFQHALTKNNLGIAYEEIAPRDVTSLRRALARFEEAMILLDPRIHQTEWSEINENMTRVAGALSELTGEDSRLIHFASLLGAVSPPEQLDFLRFRLRSYLALPDPHREQALSMLDGAIVALPKEQLAGVTRSWMKVLMEQPHEHLETGLRSRQRAHESLRGSQLQHALNATEQALGDLEVIQRVRVRDLLTELGYDRPDPS